MGSAVGALRMHRLRVGCNTLPGERYGKIKRVHNRFNA